MKTIVASALVALTCLLSPAEAQEEKPLTVGMTTWVGYGLLHLADKKGFFRDNHVDVSLLTVQDKPSTAAAIATGRLDGWATTVDTFIFYDARKIGAKQVLAIDFSTGGDGIVATDTIQTVADLKGKKLGAEEGSSTYFLLLNVLADAGMSLHDIDLQPMRAGDAGAAFAAGRLDAAATWDPWLGKAAEHGGHVLVSSADKKGLIVDTVAFREDVIEKRPEDIANFIRGYFAAYDYWKTNPTEADAIMADALGIPQAEFAASLAGLEFVSPAGNRAYIGTPDTLGTIKGVVDRGVGLYTQAGVLKQPFDAASIVDPRPLAAATVQ